MASVLMLQTQLRTMFQENQELGSIWQNMPRRFQTLFTNDNFVKSLQEAPVNARTTVLRAAIATRRNMEAAGELVPRTSPSQRLAAMAVQAPVSAAEIGMEAISQPTLDFVRTFRRATTE